MTDSRVERAGAAGSRLTLGALVIAAAVAARRLAMLPPLYAFAAIAAPIVIGVVVVTDAWLTLYVAAYPLQGINLVGATTIGFRLSHVFFLVVSLVFLWQFLARGTVRAPRLGAVDGLAALFVTFTVASIAWSGGSSASATVAAAKLAFDLLVFFVLSALMQRDAEGTLRRVAVGFCLAFVYMAGVAVYNLIQLGFRGLVASIVLEQGATGTSALQQLNIAIASLTGTAGRNIIASWMVLGLMVVWAVIGGRWRSLGGWTRASIIVAFAGAATFIVLSLSRTSWLSLVLGSITLWLVSGHRLSRRAALRLAVVAAVIGVALVASGVGALLTARVGAVSSALDTGVTGRIQVWRAVFAQFLAHPVFGVGIKGTESLTLSFTENAGNPHNVYLQILAELGLVGMIVFATLVGTMMVELWRAGRTLPGSSKWLAWGVFAAIACYLAQALTQTEFLDLGIWTLLGLGTGIIHMARATLPEPAPTPLP